MQTATNHVSIVSPSPLFSSWQEEGEEEVPDAPVDALQAEDGRSAASGHWFLGAHLFQGSCHRQDRSVVVRHHWTEKTAGIQEGELRGGGASPLRARAQLRTLAACQRCPELGLRGVSAIGASRVARAQEQQISAIHKNKNEKKKNKNRRQRKRKWRRASSSLNLFYLFNLFIA